MVVPCLFINELFEPRKRSKGFDAPVSQIKLSLCNISGIVRHRVGYIISRHGGDGKNGYRPGSLKIDRLFIACCKLTVEIARVTSIRRYLFHRDGDLLQSIRKVRHVRQQHENPLASQGEFFRHRQRDIRYHETLDNRIRRGMNEKDATGECPTFFQGLSEIEVVVVFETTPP